MAAWAIPPDILNAAPASPYTFPVELFARRADAALGRFTPSNRRAADALPPGGQVLDVGCGGGAAALPQAGRAGRLVGVDRSPEMLAAFRERAAATGVEFATIEGSWPEVSSDTPPADVVVCHHVAYNAPALASFARALTDHARRRVVMELTARHPLSAESPLWLRFHGLVRPDSPTADDAEAVLREAGVAPGREDWAAPPSGGFSRREDLVAWIRTRVCLRPDQDPEVWEAIAGDVVERDGLVGFGSRPMVTLWWDGTAT